jgi:hypothetical protein
MTSEPASTSDLSPRTRVLRDAETAVTGDRNNTYGPPTQDFQRAADALTAFGFRVQGGAVKSHHVAIIMAVLKLSRLMWSPETRDSWLDLAGYAACGHECVVQETETPNASSTKECQCDECVYGHA